MGLVSFLKRRWGGDKKALLEEAAAQRAEALKCRRQALNDLLSTLRKELNSLKEALETRPPLDSMSLKLCIENLLEDFQEALHHLLALQPKADSLLVQHLESLESHFARILAYEEEPPMVTWLSSLDLSHQDLVGEEAALLGEIRNVLGLAVPEALVFTLVGWQRCFQEGKAPRSSQDLPYKLQAELKTNLSAWFQNERLRLEVLPPFRKEGYYRCRSAMESLAETYRLILQAAGAYKPRCVIAWPESSGKPQGELYTTSPEDATQLLIRLGETSFSCPRGLPFKAPPARTIPHEDLRALWKAAYTAENFFRKPLKLLWGKNRRGELRFYGAAFLENISAETQALEAIGQAEIQISPGIVSGPLLKLSNREKSKGILWALSEEEISTEALEQVQGLLLARGEPFGPVAELCRRLRRPALFQVKLAANPGTVVTVNTYEKKIYLGGDLQKPLFLPFGGRGQKAAEGYRLLLRLKPYLFAQARRRLNLENLFLAMDRL